MAVWGCRGIGAGKGCRRRYGWFCRTPLTYSWERTATSGETSRLPCDDGHQERQNHSCCPKSRTNLVESNLQLKRGRFRTTPSMLSIYRYSSNQLIPKKIWIRFCDRTLPIFIRQNKRPNPKSQQTTLHTSENWTTPPEHPHGNQHARRPHRREQPVPVHGQELELRLCQCVQATLHKPLPAYVSLKTPGRASGLDLELGLDDQLPIPCTSNELAGRL